jgi:hypothetical protein
MSTAVFSQPELNELSVSGPRQNGEVVVSAWLHNPSDGPPFQIVDLLGDELARRDLRAPVRRAVADLPDDAQTALWGISLPSEAGHLPAGFTLAVTLTPGRGACSPSLHRAGPQSSSGPPAVTPGDADVTEFVLAGQAGYRRVQVTGGPGIDGAPIPLLTLTYVAHTPHGSLTVAFGTAHLDASDIFVALFDRIADSVRVVSAGRTVAR